MDGYRVFTVDAEPFPDLAGLVRELGVRVVTIIDPGVKAEPGYAVYDELVRRGFACLGADGRPWLDRVWPGKCVFPDFTNRGCRHWWGDLHHGLVEARVDGIWVDMNEPSVFLRGTLAGDVRHAAGAHWELHNAYRHLMAQATFEGLERLRPGRRPFVLTRAGWAGTQRFAATWTGDNRSTCDLGAESAASRRSSAGAEADATSSCNSEISNHSSSSSTTAARSSATPSTRSSRPPPNRRPRGDRRRIHSAHEPPP